MLKKCEESMSSHENAKFHLLTPDSGKVKFEDKFKGCFDFIYCFDVFPHCDIHTIYSYLFEIRKLLKKDGRAFLSTANLLSTEGWKRFNKQVSERAK